MSYHYEEKTHNIGGIHRLYAFDNGYGASVVRFKMPLSGFEYGSYTSNENEWEVAVCKLTPQIQGSKFSHGFELCYDTPITEDVIGHVDNNELEKLLDKIAALPKT